MKRASIVTLRLDGACALKRAQLESESVVSLCGSVRLHPISFGPTEGLQQIEPV